METHLALVLMALIASTLSTTAQAKPKIKVLGTGDTIAGAQTSSSEIGYKSAYFPRMT